MLTKMTLPDGSVYTFTYDSADRMAVHRAAIRTPDDRTFHVAIADPWATVDDLLELVTRKIIRGNWVGFHTPHALRGVRR